MRSCGQCAGNCAGCTGCTGCGGAMELSRGEILLLYRLAQIPFLPVVRAPEDDTPVYPEAAADERAEYSRVLQCLQKRGLISIDFDLPLRGYVSADASYPICGSFALTARGQRVVELMEYQGVSEENF